MCGRSHAMRKPGFGAREPHFLGLDAESMSSKAQVAVALAVLAPVTLSGVLLVAIAPGLWWVFTTYGWVAFPAFGLLLRGLAGSPQALEAKNRARRVSAQDRERELLEALRSEGEITPARATIRTSLTVAEADRMLKELAEGGHLEVRVRGGGLYYALWEAESLPGEGEIVQRTGGVPQQ